jgi:predicted nuclease of predicted toxin-antitoxin system
MRLLANENFPLTSYNYLKNKGFDIIAIGIDYPGITDRQVLSIAIKENRTILTFDRDYGELLFKYKLKPAKGIIYLRLVEFTPEDPGHLIEELFKLNEFIPDSKLTVVDCNGIRQRVY